MDYRTSRRISFSYQLADHVENLARLVATIAQPKLHFVVHDWGGPIGLAVAELLAARVGKIVIMNTAAFPGHVPRAFACAGLRCSGCFGAGG